MAAKRSASSAWARPWSARRKKRTSSGPSVPPSTSASTILTWQADTQAFSPAYGKALKDIRRQVFLQVHFGADYTTGEYGWTTELDEIKRSVAWQLENLQTDYIDFGFIHCLDEEANLHV